MGKVFIGSTILSVLLAVVLLTTNVETQASVNRTLKAGNKAFVQENYESAASLYEKGLMALPDQQKIRTNLGLTAMAQENWQKAIENLETAENQAMILGNAYFYLAEGQPPQQQIESYQQALDQYKIGMVQKPESMELKYNYEWVLRLLEETKQQQEEQNQEDQGQQENQGQQEENKEDGQEPSGEEGESSSEGDQGQEDKMESGQEASESDDNQEGQSQNASDDSGDDQVPSEATEEVVDPDSEAIQQILRVLEEQEEASLKNNQGLKQGEVGEGNDW